MVLPTPMVRGLRRREGPVNPVALRAYFNLFAPSLRRWSRREDPKGHIFVGSRRENNV